MTIKLHFGCGLKAIPGWENFDASPSLRLQRMPLVGRFVRSRTVEFPANARFGNIVAGLRIRPGSCRLAYSSHVVEHLALEDCGRALRNVNSYLGKGGTFRCVMPDLRKYARAYLDDNGAEASHRFMHGTLLGMPSTPNGFIGRLRHMFGNSRHRWLWDETSFAAMLTSIGFSSVRTATFGDSDDFADIEEQSSHQMAFCVEARK